MNKKLNDKELENVHGGVCATFDQPRASGEVAIHNTSKIRPDVIFVMGADSSDKIIVGTCGPTSSEK